LAIIAGPTASGKSALAMALAERLGGVIINADSAQVYRDLSVLSARPTSGDELRLPHRLFGHVDGATGYSAARWASDAKTEISKAHANCQLPLLVGGTGLYLRTLLEGIAPIPAIDPAIRAVIRALPVAEAHARLMLADSVAANRLSPTDTSRVARALEVIESTGQPLALWQAQKIGGIGGEYSLSATVLLPDRDWLLERCDRRLEAMFDNGADREVAILAARRDIPPDAPITRAIGVREITAWIEGTCSRADALAKAQIATRQYAKRQYTWFRNQTPPDWMTTRETEKDQLIEIFVTKFHE